jgi:hypothetical protein
MQKIFIMATLAFTFNASAQVMCFNLRHTGYEIVTMPGPNTYEIVSPYDRASRAVLKTARTFTSRGYFPVDMWVKMDMINDSANAHTMMPTKDGFGMKVKLLNEAGPSECLKEKGQEKAGQKEEKIKRKKEDAENKKTEKLLEEQHAADAIEIEKQMAIQKQKDLEQSK